MNNHDPKPDKIKVILILSLAYSGTTWFTLVAGSHPDAVCLGAGDRIIKDGHEMAENLCQLHPQNCNYWPSFFKNYNPEENFFIQLARHTGKNTFVINNLSLPLIDKELRHSNIDLKVIRFVRDGRAALASAIRHHPERVDSVYQAALAWLYRGMKNLQNKTDKVSDKYLAIRYEDAVNNPSDMLEKLSEFTGLTYTKDSLLYWNFEHHLATGNAGALESLIRLQGGEGFEHHRKKEYYDDLIKHIQLTQGVPKPDDSWKKMYNSKDIAAYDFVVGELMCKFGYPRLAISQTDKMAFSQQFNPPGSVEDAVKTVGPWRREIKVNNTDNRSHFFLRMKNGLSRRLKKIIFNK